MSRKSGPPATASARCWRMSSPTRYGRLDLTDQSLTENTRSAYPVEYIPNIEPSLRGGQPRNVVMLTCDAFGVMPPIAKLTPAQAMYHFLSGYTALVAGTEKGLGAEPVATFSTCFGAPFLPRRPEVYGRMLAELIARHDADCWLVNTGWSGGQYGVGQRMSIRHTRALLRAALDGSLARTRFRKERFFGLSIPEHVPGVPAEVLDPRECLGRQGGVRPDGQGPDRHGSRRILPRSRPASATRSGRRRSGWPPGGLWLSRRRTLCRKIGTTSRRYWALTNSPIQSMLRSRVLEPGDVCPTAVQGRPHRRAACRNPRSGLATLVTLTADGLIASHVPMLLDPDPAPYGTLLGHVARPNPQARGAVRRGAGDLPGRRRLYHAVLVCDQTGERQGRADVELCRHPRLRDGRVLRRYGAAACRRHPADRAQETPRAEPWAVSDAPADFIDGMLKGIVGFALPIARLEGKWKMSQNRPAEDRAGVAAGLTAEGREDVAALIPS